MNDKRLERLHPDLAEPVKIMMNPPGGGLDFHDISAARAAEERLTLAMPGPPPVIEGVTSEECLAPGPAGVPDVALRIYRPANRSEMLPALLWMHGGGYVLGTIDHDDIFLKQITLAAECVTVAVAYRLAPEHPYPAPLEDCYAALSWLASQAGDIGIDSYRIAIGGASAGGGLAAGLALLARDRTEIDIISQFLIFPMLDDRNTLLASDTLPDTLIWTRENNRIGWCAYLGDETGGDNVPAYASPSRAGDMTGLPPAFIAVGDLDLFAPEDIEYARRLVEAGVATELHVYPGGCHGFYDMAPDAAISRQFTDDFCRALKQALHP